MPTTPLLIRLPEELARRFRRNISARQRSKFVQRLLEEALPTEADDDEPLYRAALAVEQDGVLADEMAEWEGAAIEDGLAENRPECNVGRSGRK